MEQSNKIYAGVTKSAVAIEEGVYPAKLVQIIQIGSHRFEKNGKEWWSPQILLGFELPTVIFESAEGVKLSTIKSATYFLSMNESTREGVVGLREIVDGMRGKSDYTAEELQQFDISQFLGKNCFIKLDEVESKGKTYTNISEITPIKPEDIADIKIDPEVTRRTPILITLGDFPNIESFELPQWIEEKIKSSTEYQEWLAKKNQPDDGFNLDDDEEEVKVGDLAF